MIVRTGNFGRENYVAALTLLIGADQTGPSLSNYVEMRVLGSGSYGAVHSYRLRLKFKSNYSGLEYPEMIAVKVIAKGGTKTSREVENMLKLSHPNVIKHFGVEELKLFIHIKMEVANCDLNELMPLVTSSQLYK